MWKKSFTLLLIFSNHLLGLLSWRHIFPACYLGGTWEWHKESGKINSLSCKLYLCLTFFSLCLYSVILFWQNQKNIDKNLKVEVEKRWEFHYSFLKIRNFLIDRLWLISSLENNAERSEIYLLMYCQGHPFSWLMRCKPSRQLCKLKHGSVLSALCTKTDWQTSVLGLTNFSAWTEKFLCLDASALPAVVWTPDIVLHKVRDENHQQEKSWSIFQGLVMIL